MENIVGEFLEAKRNEEEWREKRRWYAQQIAQYAEAPAEGSKTVTMGGYKVKVVATVNRRVDWGALDALGLKQPPVRTKRELDLTGLRWHEKENPGIYTAIAQCITATPGAVSVTVEELDHDV